MGDLSFEDFLRVDIRTGTVIEADDFPQAKKPAYRLKIDFGDEGIKMSSAQLTGLYSKTELLGKQVLAVINFPPKQIANFFSECLVLGVSDKNDNVVLLETNLRVENGKRVH